MISNYNEVLDNFSSEVNDHTIHQIGELIQSLCNDKVKLLNEKKQLCLELEAKNNEMLRISTVYKSKWEQFCRYLNMVEEVLRDLQVDSGRLQELKQSILATGRETVHEAKTSGASSFVTTDTADSCLSSSAESVRVNPRRISRELNTEFQSLSSLSVCTKSMEQSFLQAIHDHSEENHRPHSHCSPTATVTPSNEEMPPKTQGKLDSAASVPEFLVPDAPSPRLRRLLKKASLARRDKKSSLTNGTEEEVAAASGESVPEFVDKDGRDMALYDHEDVLAWLEHIVHLPRTLLENIRRLPQQQHLGSGSSTPRLDGRTLVRLAEHKFEKLFGTGDKLIQRKILLSLDQCRSSMNSQPQQHAIPVFPAASAATMDPSWVAHTWLKRHLGLAHLAPAFLSRSIDGRLLHWLANCPTPSKQKQLLALAASHFDRHSGLSPPQFSTSASTTSAISPDMIVPSASAAPSKFEIRSIRFGLQLLAKFDFDLAELEHRRAAVETSNSDLLVWTNERISKWFHQMNLKSQVRGIEYSGLHGGLLVLDAQFSLPLMWKTLQIPIDSVKKLGLDDKFTHLLKPCRFNEGVKTRRSNTLFRRRSFSQPRQAKLGSKSMNLKSSSSDLRSGGGGPVGSVAGREDCLLTRSAVQARSQTGDFSTTGSHQAPPPSRAAQAAMSRSSHQLQPFVRTYRPRPGAATAEPRNLSPEPQQPQPPVRIDSKSTDSSLGNAASPSRAVLNQSQSGHPPQSTNQAESVAANRRKKRQQPRCSVSDDDEEL